MDQEGRERISFDMASLLAMERDKRHGFSFNYACVYVLKGLSYGCTELLDSEVANYMTMY